MDKLPAPPKFDSEGNAAEQWRVFKQAFTLYLKATDTASASAERQVALLLTVGGPALLDVYNTLDFGVPSPARPQPEFDFAHVINLLDTHFLPKHNELYSRYVFRSRMQQPEEQFDSFLTDLKLKARDCRFGTQRDSLIRDQIACGVHDEKARADILKLEDPTLEKVVKVCLAHEATKFQLKKFKEGATSDSQVHAVKKNTHRATGNGSQNTTKARNPQKPTLQKCKYCGGSHERKKRSLPCMEASMQQMQKAEPFCGRMQKSQSSSWVRDRKW